MQLAPGTIIDDKYEILSPIGMGGFGVVYKARQLAFDRIVALKILHLDRDMSAEATGRFEREARALSALKHRNVVLFYGFGMHDGSPYIVMEYLQGRALESILSEEGALPIPRAVNIVKQICDALASAHANGIVHRDIKPTNIMLSGADDQELVKVIDFGLVRLLPNGGLPQQDLTDAGNTVGSIQYMSPEQCRGSGVDSRSDIYAIGCILHRCLTGEAPFSGPSIVVIQQHVFDPPPPLNSVRAGVTYPDSLQAVIDRALAKAPEDRYQSAEEMSSDLERALRSQASTGGMRAFKVAQKMPTMDGKRSLLVPALLGIAVLSAAAAACFMYKPDLQHGQNQAANSYDLYAQAQAIDRTGQYTPQAMNLYEKALAANQKDHLLDSDGRLPALETRLQESYMHVGNYKGAFALGAKAIDDCMAIGNTGDMMEHACTFYGSAGMELHRARAVADKLQIAYDYLKRKSARRCREIETLRAQAYDACGEPQKTLQAVADAEKIIGFGVTSDYAQIMRIKASAYRQLSKEKEAQQCLKQAEASDKALSQTKNSASGTVVHIPTKWERY